MNAKIVGLDAVSEGPPTGPGLSPPQPVVLSPSGTTSASARGSGPSSGGFSTPQVAPAQCAPSLLQSVLGLGVTLLGGRPGC